MGTLLYVGTVAESIFLVLFRNLEAEDSANTRM